MIDQKIIDKIGLPISKDLIQQFENDNKIVFENDYKNFLITYGQVWLHKCALGGDSISYIGGIEYIKGINVFLDEWQENWEDKDRASTLFLIIGSTDGPDIYYGISKKNNKIYKIDLSDFPNGYITLIANSFSDFLNKIYYTEF